MTAGRAVPYLGMPMSSTEVDMSVQPSRESSHTVGLAGDKAGDATEVARSPSRARRIAFRVLAVLTSLLFLLYFVFGLMEPVLMWLPDETLSAMLGEDFSEIPAHRSHFMSVGIMAWAVVLALLVQLRRPERRVAPMLLLLTVTLSGAVVYAVSGTAGEWLVEEGPILLPVLLLAWLHPRSRDLFRRPAWDRPLVALAAVAAVPWAIFIVDNGRLQLLNAAGDSHAEMEHWATAALMAIVIVVSSFLGSTDHAGWRLPAWIAAAASVIFGMHSLAFAGQASSLPTFWAVAAVLWGVVFAVGVIRRSRGERARPTT